MLSFEEQLEAHPIKTNQQLWSFDVKSKNIQWGNLIVPLRKRGSPLYLGGNFNYMSNMATRVTEDNRREILICHDMMGNYREDRFYKSSKKWDEYRYYHWSGIDYFCYFSHKYITIPPSNWINAAHQHGVAVLGTYIAEEFTNLGEVLQTTSKIEQTVDGLVRLCEHFCFEGWLLNIECTVPKNLIDNLILFEKTLRLAIAERIPNGKVFWYDSVTHTGQLSWQNQVNNQNVRYFNESDGMLINYIWDDKCLEQTVQTVTDAGQKLSKTFFGIDVFARGQIAKFQTNQTMARIVKNKFSTGIFAPGWTYESLNGYGYNLNIQNGSVELNDSFLARNDKFWSLLWEYFATYPYDQLPFYTDFCIGSGERMFQNAEPIGEQFFCLSKQSLQPSIPLWNFAEHNFKEAINGGSCLNITKYDQSFRIFLTDFEVKSSLVFSYAYKLDEKDGNFDCIFRFSHNDIQKDCYVFMGNYNGTSVFQKGRCYISPIAKDFQPLLADVLHKNGSHMKIPTNLPNGWNVRYYVINFEKAIRIKDIGVLYRKEANSQREYVSLGAIFLDALPVSVAMQPESNVVDLKYLTDSLLN